MQADNKSRTKRLLFAALVLTSQLASAHDGVVSTSHPAALAAGARMLAQGGNAIDAAAAIQFALNVVEPQSSGIGGGGFMMIYLARDREIVIVDSRERAPARAGADQFAPEGLPMAFNLASTSGLSVGVPGTVRGIDLALRRWGSMKLADTLLPAIELADGGFRVNRFLAEDLAGDAGRTALYPETAAIFRPGGTPLAEGDWLVQPDLARTLRLLASQGANAFYQGPLAQAIIRAQARGRAELGESGHGRMTLEDLAAYQPTLRRPLYPPAPANRPARPESPHTTHFSVIDRQGNLVSYTSTIEATWGSGITVPGYGFLLNNELTDFNFLPAADPATGNPGANDVAAGKRPRSSMAPVMLLKDGKPVAAYGSPGGATIINTVFNVTLNLIDHGMNMQQAIDETRISVTHAGGRLQREGGMNATRSGLNATTLAALRAQQHAGLGEAGDTPCRGSIGSVQAVMRNGEAHEGAADARREGTVIRVTAPR